VNRAQRRAHAYGWVILTLVLGAVLTHAMHRRAVVLDTTEAR
jgi:hypothetical protein